MGGDGRGWKGGRGGEGRGEGGEQVRSKSQIAPAQLQQGTHSPSNWSHLGYLTLFTYNTATQASAITPHSFLIKEEANHTRMQLRVLCG